MLGLFKSKTERKLLKLERTMMTMERAAEQDNLGVLHQGMQEQVKILNWLSLYGDRSENEVMEWIKNRGLVRSVHDDAIHDFMCKKGQDAEMTYGMIG